MGHAKPAAPATQATTNRVMKTKPTQTPAARYNRKILRGLEHAISKDPEADIAQLLTLKYSDFLQSFKCKMNGLQTS
ncbi:hypothetical protein CORC01_05311 [Colletotrichum orchidophilum]|uniref:Uncharacterized protein n=1 Tax=Colletotrichum orchidophilum TaxID=1209926 RepID=A0A1G4BD22_9PEZI|nr:uncharacterized protein CORC01_05311 [Colletotrichum orchidophilum]OHE99270.1 hypothetical protein CORC01_05311 [Colletotrichum orchidophilum]